LQILLLYLRPHIVDKLPMVYITEPFYRLGFLRSLKKAAICRSCETLHKKIKNKIQKSTLPKQPL